MLFSEFLNISFLFLLSSQKPYNVISLSEDTKHAGNTLLERITQCVRPETYRSKVTDDQVMRSLLLQMNAKCGGVSVTVDWPSMKPVSGLAYCLLLPFQLFLFIALTFFLPCLFFPFSSIFFTLPVFIVLLLSLSFLFNLNFFSWHIYFFLHFMPYRAHICWFSSLYVSIVGMKPSLCNLFSKR